ncbi:MAG: efflux RND transporter periplasmic adaptor subunit [Planctomycetota bacterium]|jgi:Cu(I)/Ag(I) efflux system membrane fusion protein
MNNLIAKVWKTLSKLPQRPKVAFAVVIGILIGVTLHWALGAAQMANEEHVTASQEQTAESATVWTCSMHPQIKLPKPGLCPICNMDLIPLTMDETETGASMRQLTVSESAKELMDIEIASVERKFVSAVVRMVGKVDYDETNLAYITAWVPGRLDKLYVDYTGVPVNKGDHMVYLYSPELISAQEELLQAIEAVKNIQKTELGIMREMTESTANAAREKLRLWGLTPEQITEIERTGQVTDHMTIYSPTSGIVIHKNALEGMYVQTGTKIYTIADLSKVWVKLDAYESDLMWLRYGQEMEFTTVSYPGQIFKGTISFIDPILNDRTRTVKIRVNVQNPDGKLKPGMFVKAVVRSQVAGGGRIMDAGLVGKWICPMHPEIIKETSGSCDICGMPLVTTESRGYVSDDPALTEEPLVIPVTAALVTGTRAIVYVQVPDANKPTFEGREIALGPRAGDYYLVRRGLKEGELVVVKGNFKIDSSLQIMAKPSMMTPEGAGGGGAKPAVELPALSKYQIQDVLAKAQVVKKAVESEDIQKIKSAFSELDQSLKNVDMELLTGHVHMLWMEYHMRLSNNAVEGIHAKTVKDARKAAKFLAENISFMAAKFGLIQKQPASEGPGISDTFRKQLAKVFESYFAIQQALANDKIQLATESAKKASDALKAVDMKLLSGQDHVKWMKFSTELESTLSRASQSKDIKLLREDFYLLSQQLTKIAKRFGATGQSPFYVLRCPMAFDNTGADWLQDNDQTSNPYFGQMMLRCGGIEEVIGTKEIWEKKDK